MHVSNTILAVPDAAARTSKLLRLASSVIGNKQRSVVLDEGLLQGVLAVLVDEFLVVCDDRLGDGLTDGVDLGSVSTTGNSDADIDASELVEADNQEGLVDLESQDLGLDEVEGLAVDLNQSLTSLIFFSSVSYPPVYLAVVRTLQWATAVAVGKFCQYLAPFSNTSDVAAYLSSSCRSIAHSGLSMP